MLLLWCRTTRVVATTREGLISPPPIHNPFAFESVLLLTALASAGTPMQQSALHPNYHRYCNSSGKLSRLQASGCRRCLCVCLLCCWCW